MGMPVEQLYGGLAILFCLFIISASLIGLLCWRAKTNNVLDADAFYMVFIVEACIIFTDILYIYIVYLGIPTWLTFGYQIGKILPATCEASMPIEGKDGLPCSSRRLLDWLERATNGSGNWSWDEFEVDWRRWLVIVVVVIGLNVVVAIYWQILRIREIEQRAVKQGSQNETEGVAMQEV